MIAVRLTPASVPSELLQKCETSSLFTSPGFGELWRSVKGRPIYWAVRKGENIKILLPGVEFGVGPLKRFQAMPDGCYAKLIQVDADADTSELVTLLLAGIIRHAYAKLSIVDRDNIFPTGSHLDLLECTTTLVDISSPDWQPPAGKLGQEIRAAERRGVTPVPFDAERHLESFLALVQKSPPGPEQKADKARAFYTALSELAKSEKRIRWLVIEHDGCVAAAHINFMEEDMVLAWRGFFDRRFASILKPNDILLNTIVRQAQSEGIKWLNLGATPEAATGAAAYKQKWKGIEYRYKTLMARTLLGRMA